MNDAKPSLTRRSFSTEVAAATTAFVVAPRIARGGEAAAEFRSRWNVMPDRSWAGAEFWTNPMQDWRVASGRLECVKAAPARNVHVLTRSLEDRSGTLTMSVKLGRVAGLKWRPHVFAAGNYTLRVTEPETGKRRELKGIAATKGNRATLEVVL